MGKEPDGLQSMKSKRVGQDWMTNTNTHTFTFQGRKGVETQRMAMTLKGESLRLIEFKRQGAGKRKAGSCLLWSTVVCELAVLLKDVVFLRICIFLSSVVFQLFGVWKSVTVALDRCYFILNSVRWFTDLDHLAGGVVVRYFHCKVTLFFLPLHTMHLGRKTFFMAHTLLVWSYVPFPWEQNIYINYLEYSYMQILCFFSTIYFSITSPFYKWLSPGYLN